MNRLLFVSAMIIGAVYMCTPRSDAGDPAEATATATATAAIASERSAEPQEMAIAYFGAGTSLPRSPDGHFYTMVAVNGQQQRFLVDTGASMIALTGEDARALGLSWHPAELTTVGHGAGGPVAGTVTRLDRVALGPFEARDIDAVIIPEGLPVSLLGQNFLSDIPSVRIENDTMVLGG